MPKLIPIKTSMAAGEISPLMYGRTDTGGYGAGVKSLVNMTADSRGPALCRRGLRHVGRYEGDHAKTIGFTAADGKPFIVLFRDLVADAVNIAGTVPSKNFVMNGAFTNGSDSWTVTSSGNGTTTFLNNRVVLAPQNTNDRYEAISQEITVDDGALEHTIVVTTPGGSAFQVMIGNATEDGSILDETSVEVVEKYTFTPGTTTFWVTVRVNQVDLDYPPGQSTVYAVSIIDETTGESSFVTPWPEEEVGDLQFIQAPGSDTIYIVHPRYAPQKIEYDPVAEAWMFSAVEFTGAPSSWEESNWPSCGTFYQGRLWLGGAALKPETFWGSKSGLPTDFTIGTLPDDALEFTLEQYGRIEWMAGTKNLLMGTAVSEYIISSDGGVIHAGDIFANRQSAYGSRSIQASQVGDQVLYVSPDGRKVRAMQYEWSANNWLSKDLTFTSEHITVSGIQDVAWSQNPDNILWAPLTNGKFIGMTYERSNNIYGWHNHTTDGKVIDCSSVEFDGSSFAVFVVQRVEGQVDVEIMWDGTQLDSWVDYTIEPPTDVVTGLDHLEGKEVQIIVDGAVHPSETVTSGQIQLQYSGSRVVVGLQFIPRVEMLPVEQMTAAGSLQTSFKHWSKIFVRTLESNAPLINGIRPADRSPSTPMDTGEIPKTGDFSVSTLGNTEFGTITIEQDLPVPLNILAVFGELGTNSL